MISEFELISKYFKKLTNRAVLGVGEDAALLRCGPDAGIAITTDTLVEGVHFFSDCDPFFLGRKVLAVNFSDLAAMGARPHSVLLSLSLRECDESWLASFSDGFHRMLEEFQVELVGGDTTRADQLVISVTALGDVDIGSALRRDRAQVGDDVWVSGELGLATLALASRDNSVAYPRELLDECNKRLNNPEPRVALGRRLIGVANCAIDISDGLVADAGHISTQSEVGIEVILDQIPTHRTLIQLGLPQDDLVSLISGGDDYELLFTCSRSRENDIGTLSRELKIPITKIGAVVEGRGVILKDRFGKIVEVDRPGYEHFSRRT